MKNTILILLLSCGTAAAQLRTNVTLQWNYPSEELTNMAFFIYGTNNLGAPVATWPTIGLVVAVTNGLSPTNITIPLQPQAYWFVARASNYWGLSDFSNVALVPAPPRSDVRLQLK